MFSVKYEARAGWWVSEHVVDRFRERVGTFGKTREEIATWLRANAHLSVPIVGEKLRDGKRYYRLEHPWGKPDAVLVVGIDPDGTMAAVTCGWWEEDAAPDTSQQGTVTSPVKTVDETVISPVKTVEAKGDRKFLPPSFLARPKGSLQLDFLEKGLSLDPRKLMMWELLMWQKLVVRTKTFNAQGVKGGDKITKVAKAAEKVLSSEIHGRWGEGDAASIDMLIYESRMQQKDDEIASLKAALTKAAK